MALNKLHSFKDYLNQSLKHLPAEEFNNSTIRGSCFYQEITYGNVLPIDGVDIFPDGVTGLILDGCNVDNVYIKPGITVNGSSDIQTSQRKIMANSEGADCLTINNDGILEPDNTKQL